MSHGMLCIAIAKDVKVTGSGWTLVDCPYVLPAYKRPEEELQTSAYAYPNANARILVDGKTGKIRVGSGDASSLNLTISALVMWPVGI